MQKTPCVCVRSSKHKAALVSGFAFCLVVEINPQFYWGSGNPSGANNKKGELHASPLQRIKPPSIM